MEVSDLLTLIAELKALGQELSSAELQCLTALEKQLSKYSNAAIALTKVEGQSYLTLVQSNKLSKIIETSELQQSDSGQTYSDKANQLWLKLKSELKYMRGRQLIQFIAELEKLSNNLPKYDAYALQIFKATCVNMAANTSVSEELLNQLTAVLKDRFQQVNRDCNYFLPSKLNNLWFHLAAACARDPRLRTNPLRLLIPTLETAIDSKHRPIAVEHLPETILSEDEKSLILIADPDFKLSPKQLLSLIRRLVYSFLPNDTVKFVSAKAMAQFFVLYQATFMEEVDTKLEPTKAYRIQILKFIAKLRSYAKPGAGTFELSAAERQLLVRLLKGQSCAIHVAQIQQFLECLESFESIELNPVDCDVLSALSLEYRTLPANMPLNLEQKAALLELLHARFRAIPKQWVLEQTAVNQLYFDLAAALANDIDINCPAASLLIPDLLVQAPEASQPFYKLVVDLSAKQPRLVSILNIKAMQVKHDLLEPLIVRFCSMLHVAFPGNLRDLSLQAWKNLFENFAIAAAPFLQSASTAGTKSFLNDIVKKLEGLAKGKEPFDYSIIKNHQMLIADLVEKLQIQIIESVETRLQSVLKSISADIHTVEVFLGKQQLDAVLRERLWECSFADRPMISRIIAENNKLGGKPEKMLCELSANLRDILQRLKSALECIESVSRSSQSGSGSFTITALYVLFKNRWLFERHCNLDYLSDPSNVWVELARYLSAKQFIALNYYRLLMPTLKNALDEPFTGQRITDRSLDHYLLSDGADYLIDLEVLVRQFQAEQTGILATWVTDTGSNEPHQLVLSYGEKQRLQLTRSKFAQVIRDMAAAMASSQDAPLKRATIMELKAFINHSFKPSTIDHNKPEAKYTREEERDAQLSEYRFNMYLQDLQQRDPEEYQKLMTQRSGVATGFMCFADHLNAMNERKECFGVLGWQFIRLILEYEPDFRFPERIETHLSSTYPTRRQLDIVKESIKKRNYSDPGSVPLRRHSDGSADLVVNRSRNSQQQQPTKGILSTLSAFTGAFFSKRRSSEEDSISNKSSASTVPSQSSGSPPK